MNIEQRVATMAELLAALAGRAPMFWHEPLLQPRAMLWHVEALPIIMVSSDLWTDLLAQLGCPHCRGLA